MNKDMEIRVTIIVAVGKKTRFTEKSES